MITFQFLTFMPQAQERTLLKENILQFKLYIDIYTMVVRNVNTPYIHQELGHPDKT